MYDVRYSLGLLRNRTVPLALCSPASIRLSFLLRRFAGLEVLRVTSLVGLVIYLACGCLTLLRDAVVVCFRLSAALKDCTSFIRKTTSARELSYAFSSLSRACFAEISPHRTARWVSRLPTKKTAFALAKSDFLGSSIIWRILGDVCTWPALCEAVWVHVNLS